MISNEIALVSARPRPMKKMVSPVYEVPGLSDNAVQSNLYFGRQAEKGM
jgi:hypothetical protein